MRIKKALLAALALTITGPQTMAQVVTPFVEGDRAVFLGNSITDSGHYHSYIWLFYQTRFPMMPITIINAGIGGDSAHEMYRRLDDDVLSNDPTVLMISFGMNDSGYLSEITRKNRDSFAENKYQRAVKQFDQIVEAISELPFTRIVMVGSSPYDENAVIPTKPYKGKNSTLQRIIAYQRLTADSYGWEFVDFNEPMVAINTLKQETDSSFTLSGPRDRIHPDNEGDMVMAYLFLKAQGMDQSKVADIAIHAAPLHVERSENCSISSLKHKDGNGIAFDYIAHALPYPVDTIARGGKRYAQSLALDDVPFTEEMNQERLTIAGLSSGYYLLSIDGVTIGTFSADSLSRGINLAAYDNAPQYQQALEVMRLNEQRWALERTYRQYKWCLHTYMPQKGLDPANPKQAAKEMRRMLRKNAFLLRYVDSYERWAAPQQSKELNQQLDELVTAIYKTAQPISRHFVLTPQ